MSETTSKVSNTYQFLMTRIQDKSEGAIPHISDFYYIAFIRDIIRRQSTFIEAFALISRATISLIDAEISVGNYPSYELTGYELTGDGNDNEDKKQIYKTFYSTNVIILCAESQKENISSARNVEDYAVPVKLLLVHPIAYQMSKNTGLNINYSPVVTPEPKNPKLIALETIINNQFNPQYNESEIESFTQSVVNKYASQPKHIKQIVFGDRSNLNLTNYGCIYVPATIPEINVPEYIINNYKPFNTPSYWFLDTFNFGDYDNSADSYENGKIPIWAILINFFNCINTFKKEDISKNIITMVHTHLLKREDFIDSFGTFNRPNAIVNFIDGDSKYHKIKMGDLPKRTVSDNSQVVQDSQVTSFTVFYNDTIDAAKDRLVACRQLFNNQIDCIEFFESPLSTPEWLQFGKLYNMEYDDSTNENTFRYVHTPITIMNIFKRRQIKDDTMENINKYAMLRLIDKQ